MTRARALEIVYNLAESNSITASDAGVDEGLLEEAVQQEIALRIVSDIWKNCPNEWATS